MPVHNWFVLITINIYYMAPLSRKHQRIITELSTIINHYIKLNNGSCEVDLAPFAVFLSENDKTYVEPDISVICDKNKLTDKGCNGAPDWSLKLNIVLLCKGILDCRFR